MKPALTLFSNRRVGLAHLASLMCVLGIQASLGCQDERVAGARAEDQDTHETYEPEIDEPEVVETDSGPPDSGPPDTVGDIDAMPPDDTDDGVDTFETETIESVTGSIVADPPASQLVPGTVVALDVALPSELEGRIESWRWTVIQPTGSTAVFTPDATVSNPSIELWVVGSYTFGVEHQDDQGQWRYAREMVVTVTPTDTFHIELTWHTPGDADETDTGGEAHWSAGSDVDLHLLHANGQGRFFDPTWDCFFETLTAEWGGPGAQDNPFLDRDDTDGAGPEVLSLEHPEALRYRVGVHYWNDWTFGRSLATVRVFFLGELVDEWAHVELHEGDLWESHTIEWPSRFVTRITAEGGRPFITPDYEFVPWW